MIIISSGVSIYITEERPGRGSEGQTVKGKRASDRKLPLRLRILKGGGLAASLLEAGYTLRENMADAYWAAVTEELAGMYGSDSSSEYDFSDPATYNTIFNQDSTSDKDVGLFNKLWEGYNDCLL